MNAGDYIRTFDAFGRHLITMPCGSATTGSGYMVGTFSDGGVVAVVDVPDERERIVLDWSSEPLTNHAADTLTHAARCVALVDREKRGRIVRAGGCEPGGVLVIDGVRWSSDGGYRGLDWK